MTNKIYVDGGKDAIAWFWEFSGDKSWLVVPKASATGNQAEYHALILALADAISNGITEATIFMDSQLVVRQMTGQYKVKSPDLRPLYLEAQALCRWINVKFEWIPREQNKAGHLLEDRK